MRKIGIDFGTTKTMVSFFNPTEKRVNLVRLGRDKDSIPTTFYVDESGDFLFGDDADDQIEVDPEGYCRAFKLNLGENDLLLSRSELTAEDITANFLRYIKKECEQEVFFGETVSAATITIPVSFSPARKESLKRAAKKAGFKSVTFLSEPEAAGIAFFRENSNEKFSRALVLDWGGGTLDIAAISRTQNGGIKADKSCFEGSDEIGGEAIDVGLLENMCVIWEGMHGENLVKDELEEVKFRRLAQRIKEQLSKKEKVTFRKGTKAKCEITRDKFNRIIQDILEEVVNLVASALEKNRKRGNVEPDALILIGGTSLIPAVRTTMEQRFPDLRVLSWHHSHEAVALGATTVEEVEAAYFESSKQSKDYRQYMSEEKQSNSSKTQRPPKVLKQYAREEVYTSCQESTAKSKRPPKVQKQYAREEVYTSSRGDFISDITSEGDEDELSEEDILFDGVYAYIGMLAKMAKIDGRVSRLEIKCMEELISEWGLDEEDEVSVKNIFRKTKDSDEDIFQFAELFLKVFEDDVDSRKSVYVELWRMAQADNSGAEKKIEVLRAIPRFLGLPDEIFDEVVEV